MVYDWVDPSTVEFIDEEVATYQGKWSLSENNCLLEFESDRPLPMGRAFKLDLSKVTDIAGNKYEGRQIRFATFEPYVMSPSTCSSGINKNKIMKGSWLHGNQGS